MPGSAGAVLTMMKAELDKNILIFLLSSIGLIVFPHVYHIPIAVFSFFCLLLSWRFIGAWKQNWLPGKRGIFLMFVCAIALLYSQHQGLFGRDAGTNLFITALGLKLLEIKKERDLYLISYLAFIVAASQFLYQQSIVMAAYILLVCCALLATLICINSCKVQTLSALKTAVVIIFQALPIAVSLFILFPRVEAPQWMLFKEQHQTRTGLSDSMEPGSISELGMSDELVFRVKFAGAIPPSRQRYWRGPVLSYTDGRRWTQAPLQKPLSRYAVTGTPYPYTLMMEPQDKNWIFALDMPAQYSSPLTLNTSYQLITLDSPGKRTEYKVTSYTDYNTGPISSSEYKVATQLPGEPSDKIKQLVGQLHGFDSVPDNFINQLLNHFRVEDFHYTLTPPIMEENPIESFLFKTRYGFCSHYASAFVYLIRVAHIPARVVTGYQGGELNKVGDFLEIRQADAHAWAEVWLENRGWVRVDPTAAIAPERIERNTNLGRQTTGGIATENMPAYNLLQQARQLWSSVDYSWQRWVINYDNKSQSSFLSLFGISDLKAMIYWMIAVIGLITALLCWFLLRQKTKAVDKALLSYNRFCKKLAKHGLLRGAGEGVKDFAERVKIKLPGRAEDIDRITSVFIRLRYGRIASDEDLQQLKTLVGLFRV
ncbi:transglutaminase TgpA family protein [Methylobacter sp.]|uniref:transglutaminase TgpA family protein n=1 Tax=Methylobacter sp. TaxID=2051955 RepID=UPI002FDE4064